MITLFRRALLLASAVALLACGDKPLPFKAKPFPDAPMAANFNLVPAILLGLPDRHAVIRAQAPMAAAIWIFNVVLMALCVYRF